MMTIVNQFKTFILNYIKLTDNTLLEPSKFLFEKFPNIRLNTCVLNCEFVKYILSLVSVSVYLIKFESLKMLCLQFGQV